MAMSLPKKVTVIGLLLTAFALWPLLHYVVIRQYFVSPWRLFGWAMYCVPIYQPRVRFFVPQGDQQREIEFPMKKPGDVMAYQRFIRYRAELGTLIEADQLGQILFREHPELESVIVQVEQPVYHYDSTRIAKAYFEYSLSRVRQPTACH